MHLLYKHNLTEQLTDALYIEEQAGECICA